MNTKMPYAGFYHDKHGMPMLARVVLDGWLFGLLPESEDCAGWQLGQMQTLADKIEAEWDQYGNLPSRLPSDMRERHEALYRMATERARGMGWDPELGEDE